MALTETTALEDQGELLNDSGPLRSDPAALEDQQQLLTESGAPQFREVAGLEDGFQCHINDSDYVKGRLDEDGRELAANTSIRHVLYYDATADPWHAHGAGFYGAGRDGRLYYDGVECGPGPFSIGSPAGLNRTAWGSPGGYLDRLPVANAAALTYPTAGTIEVAPVSTTTQVGSTWRWFFTDDFDIQIDYQIISAGSGPTTGGIALEVWMDSNNRAGVRRKMFGSNSYEAFCLNNGSWGANPAVGTSDTSGKLRMVRVGAALSMYYWNGSSWTQIGSDYTMTYTRPMWVAVGSWFNTTPVGTVFQVSGWQINSGSTTNLIGWAREAAGTYRGALTEFPQHVLFISSGNSLDIVDVDTDKLWMSFRGGTNNVLWGDSNYYVPQVQMRDGVLLVNQRTFDSYGTNSGFTAWIDFTVDFIRMHRGSTYNDAGLIYNVELTTGIWPRDSSDGVIRWRNNARGYYASHYDNWQYQSMRTNWCDLLHDSGFQYRLIANAGGVYLSKWERWKFEGLINAHLNTPDYGISTVATACRWAMFDPTTKALYYHDRTKLYIVAFSTWDIVISGGGGTWVEDQEFTLAGSIDAGESVSLAQDKMVLYDGYLWYARQQGVYRMDLTTGTSVLFYGKVGSGATYENLPNYSTISSLQQATDGTTPVMVIGMTYPDRTVAVNLTTHALYWKGRVLDSRTPVSMGVGA